MKHAIKAFGILLVLVLVACSSNDSDSEGPITGKWQGSDDNNNECPDTIQLNDNEDHTFKMTHADKGEINGTYKDLEDDDEYELDVDGDEQVLKFVRDGDTLTVTDTDSNDTCTYEVESSDDENEDNNNDENADETEDNNNNESESVFNNDQGNANDGDNLGGEENEDTNPDYEQYRSQVESVDDEGDSDIWIEAEATYEHDEIIVFGQTNLLPDSELNVNPTGDDSTITGGWTNVDVQEDGTFYAENDVPSDFDDTLIQEITFTPDKQEDDIKSHYQPEEDKLDGPFAYLEKDGEEDMMTIIEATLEFEEGKSHSKAKVEKPQWDEPDDYGETDIWMEADIDKDDDYVYIEGTSNLLEGTVVEASFEMADKIQIGYNDKVKVNPDGSFEAKIENPEEDVDDYSVELKVSPYNNEWPNVIDAYGEDGEKFEGDLTDEKEDVTRIIKEFEVK